jgi:hypothetical protein
VASDWSRYWRSGDEPLEAMHAHFQRHAYHRHSHETYSFGVTEAGVQSFNCRGSARASAAGMIMAFNPDDPHDGQACDELGFTYRMVHVGPELVSGVLGDITGRPTGLPLFADPVVSDPVLAGQLRALHRSLLGGAAAYLACPGGLRRHRVVLLPDQGLPISPSPYRRPHRLSGGWRSSCTWRPPGGRRGGRHRCPGRSARTCRSCRPPASAWPHRSA